MHILRCISLNGQIRPQNLGALNFSVIINLTNRMTEKKQMTYLEQIHGINKTLI